MKVNLIEDYAEFIVLSSLSNRIRRPIINQTFKNFIKFCAIYRNRKFCWPHVDFFSTLSVHVALKLDLNRPGSDQNWRMTVQMVRILSITLRGTTFSFRFLWNCVSSDRWTPIKRSTMNMCSLLTLCWRTSHDSIFSFFRSNVSLVFDVC